MMSSCSMSRDADVRALFEALDRDRNGYVDKNELRATMKDVGLELSDADLDLMMKAAVLKDRLFYEDFIRLMTGSVGRLHRKFLKLKQISARKSKEAVSKLTNNYNHEATDEFQNPDSQGMRVAFALFDRNGDGILTEDEIDDTLKSLDVSISPRNIQMIMEKVNRNANGALDFGDFRAVMFDYYRRRLSSGSKPRSDFSAVVASATASVTSFKDGARSKTEVNCSTERPRSEELVSAAFKIFDKDKDGYLNAFDLRSTMKQLGLILTEDDVRAMMRSVDVGPFGKISYSEFCRIYRNKTDANAEKDSLRRSNCRKKLPKRLERELRGVFEMFDLNGDGFITISEVTEVLNSMGVNPSIESIQDVFHQVDLDGNGKIDFREFLLLALKYERPLPEDRETREMFNALDKDKNGFIDTCDLKTSFAGLGIHLTNGDVQEMMNEVEATNNKIHFNDFAQILQKHFARRLRLFKSMKVLQVKDFANGYDAKDLDSDQNAVPVGDESKTRCATKSHDTNSSPSRDKRDTTEIAKYGAGENGVSMATNEAEKNDVKVKLRSGQPRSNALTGNATTNFQNGGISSVDDSDSLDSCLRSSSSSSSFSRNSNIRRGSRWESIFTPSTVATICQTNDSYSTTPNTWIAFKVFDRNADGYISKAELQQTMSELGVRLSDEELEMMMKEADVNGDGKIDYTEFSKLMRGSFDKYAQEVTRLHELSQSQTAKSSTGLWKDGDGGCRNQDEEEIRTAFMVFDMDCNGLIDATELRMTMTHLGKIFTQAQVEEMIKAVDRNHDGKIDYKEFLEMMKLV